MLKFKMMRNVILVVGTMLASVAYGDQFHYNNVLMGGRATGMGGAFTAVADDASGVVYNPAGLAFSLSSDISGSATTFYRRNITYKDTVFGKDFTEESQGSLAPFVGALGKLDHISPGLVWAFGIYSTDSELKDQDDLIKYDPDSDGILNSRFHRTANARASTYRYGVAVGKRFSSSFALGFGLNFVMIDELNQIYQDSQSLRSRTLVDDNGDLVTNSSGDAETVVLNRTLTQNLRERLTAQALEPTFGLQVAFAQQFSFGLAIKYPFLISQEHEQGFERTITYQNISSGKSVDITEINCGTEAEPAACASTSDPYRGVIENQKEDNPLGELPLEVRGGFAWFANPSFLLTFDTIYHGEAKGDLPAYERDAVLDFALGTEWYVAPSWPLRVGLFTNNDARPEPESGKTNQRDHIDYNGASLFIAKAEPNSQVSIGAIYQVGAGKAQKISGSTDIQDVEAKALTLGFTASQNF